MPPLTTPGTLQRRTLVERNLQRAMCRLEKRLYPAKGSRIPAGNGLQIPLFDANSPIEVMSYALEHALYKAMESRDISSGERTDKVRGIMQGWLRACYPFVRLLIATAKVASQVAPSVAL
jgi:hypothetical protein